MKMDDRIKKNPKNELLEDIRKIVKEEIKRNMFPTRYCSDFLYWHPDFTNSSYQDTTTYSLRITGHSSF